MIHACNTVQSAKYVLKSSERMKDGLQHESEMLIKTREVPRSVYIYCVNPNPGAEVLWHEGTPGEKMLVNPNGFPYITLKLTPEQPMLRRNSHHTVPQIGFSYLNGLVEYYLSKYGERMMEYMSIADTVMWDGRTCVVVNFNFPDFGYLPYTVELNEDITMISRKLHLNDFSILLLNPLVKDYKDVIPGQVIRIPNFYSKRIEFYVDRSNWLPLVQAIYDENGLYEKYEFRSFLLNPPLLPEEFTADYGKYHF